ncbi:hypothetical protein MSAN_01138700 [Mycena sanguinolenta]|uniref:Uncharacterized protein n=1 Tax=Mycena sanguinolenta TaxID=230812 RepID=A0A8H7D6E8_9AGAR|nr:hypothetical protein MSAN_01138700 [Mycena sanguinolenta]
MRSQTNPPSGWTTCQHPEGAQYFFHEEKRVFTDANLFDAASLALITHSLRIVNDFFRAHNVDLSPGVDLVLDECTYSDGSKGCQYYFVNHVGRCVFWMDNGESEMFPVTAELKGMKSASHIRHELEAQYWLHCEYYPRAFNLTHEIIDELRDIVLHAFGDVVTSNRTTVPWKIGDLNNMITLIDGFTKGIDRNTTNKFSGCNCLVGRLGLVHVFARSRVYNFHGEPGARLNVDQSVHATVKRQTMFIRTLNPLLFYAPHAQLLGVRSVNIDGLIRHSWWAPFVEGLISQWQESIINAAVVLNANVAFLSIQSVDQGGNIASTRSPAQIASYVSILTSIASIIIGLLLTSRHRNRDRDSAADAATFVFSRTHPKFGLEILAVLYSLPYAMLIWSMVSFLIAFSFACFQKTSLPTRTLVSVVWAAIAALILWCVFNLWEIVNWDWLCDLRSWLRFPEREDEADADQQDEARSTVASELRPSKWRSAVSWPIIIFRKMYNSRRSVPAV